MALKPIQPRESAHRACEHALRNAVLTGELSAGDRLPPERELADTLGVSRLTLRAALATLAAQGLLAVRQGSGYIVQDFTRTGGSELLPAVAELAAERGALLSTAADLLRVRRHIAHAVLEHLVDHPPKVTAIRTFERAVEAMATVAEQTAGSASTTAGSARTTIDLEALAIADLDVVAALLDATDSPVFRLCLNPVIAVVARSSPLRAAIYAEPSANVTGWRALATWLRKPTRADAAIALLAARDTATLQRLAHRRSLR